MAGTPGIQSAVQRRLGINDPRGPEGIAARGANVYRGGMPQAHMGGGNPNLGRPSTTSVSQPGTPSPPQSLTAYVGSLPPGGGSQDPTTNNAFLDLIKRRYGLAGT